MEEKKIKNNGWHLPNKKEVYPTIDASIFVKQNFEDMSKYLIRRIRKNVPHRTNG